MKDSDLPWIAVLVIPLASSASLTLRPNERPASRKKFRSPARFQDSHQFLRRQDLTMDPTARGAVPKKASLGGESKICLGLRV